MAVEVRVEINGQEETARAIDIWDMKGKVKMREIVRKTASGVGRDARKMVPVSPSDRVKTSGSPGDLKKSIKVKYFFDNLGAMVVPDRPQGSHRAIIEHGTKIRTNSSGANRGSISPHPFMEPAKRSREGTYKSEIAAFFNGETVV